MKVLESTKTRLTLHHKPFRSWLWGACLIALGAGTGILLAGFTPVATTLNCSQGQPKQVNCQMSEFTALGMSTRRSLSNVQNASVAVGRRSKGGQYYYITLTHDGIEEAIPNSENRQETAEQINTFIQAPSRSPLFINYSQRFQISFQILMTGLFLGYGIYLAQCPIITCTFYKRMHQMVVVQKRLGVTSVLTYSLDQITRTDLQEHRDRYGRQYRIVFSLSTGKKLPLTQDYARNHNDQASLLHLIKSFLAAA